MAHWLIRLFFAVRPDLSAYTLSFAVNYLFLTSILVQHITQPARNRWHRLFSLYFSASENESPKKALYSPYAPTLPSPTGKLTFPNWKSWSRSYRLLKHWWKIPILSWVLSCCRLFDKSSSREKRGWLKAFKNYHFLTLTAIFWWLTLKRVFVIFKGRSYRMGCNEPKVNKTDNCTSNPDSICSSTKVQLDILPRRDLFIAFYSIVSTTSRTWMNSAKSPTRL